jgi:hypothetical protein
LERLLFDMARTTIKYGDCFFRKVSDFKPWVYVDPGDVIGVSLKKDSTKIDFYQVRNGDKNKQGAFGDVDLVPAPGMVHFSLSSNMGDSGPFGESVLAPVVKAHRHLSLLEDAVIIYRIVRAPERRVFMIDVGNMSPQRARAYLESVKNEIRQKRVPNEMGGQEKIDSIYNPMAMNEDFFFMQTAEGRGSRVDTLAGGENLGEISDLNYFQNRFLQGLRIPSSYMRGATENGAQVQDGKVGVAYIEELQFANYVNRLQTKLNKTFDHHFKDYLKSAGINISPNLFVIKLNEPQNFKEYKQAEVDEKLISNFNNIKDIDYISPRFALGRYLGWSEDEIQMNESMLKQERAIPDHGICDRLNDLRMIYDKKWAEERPAPKVDDSYEDFTEETKKPGEPVDEPKQADATEEPADDNAEAGDEAEAPEQKGTEEDKSGKKAKPEAEPPTDEPAKGEEAASEEPPTIAQLDAAING